MPVWHGHLSRREGTLDMQSLGIALFFASIFFAQEPGQQPAAGNAQGKKERCVLEGRVVSAATGDPVARAVVVARPRVQTPDPENQSGGVAMETDEGGTFHFEKLEAGKYDVSASKAGFLRTNFGARRPNGPGVPVELQPGQTSGDINLKMAPQAMIAGTVTDDHGEPAYPCHVQLVKRGWMGGKPGLMSSANGPTDSQGNFHLAPVEPGKYYLRADYSINTYGQQPQLVDREGNVIKVRLVSTYFGDTASLDGATLIPVQPGQELTGINVRLRREAVYHIKGKIVSLPGGDSPLNYYMYLFGRTTLNFFSMGGGGTRPKRNGDFEIENVQPGQYQLTLNRMEGRGVQFPVPVEVSGDIDNFEISIPSPAEIHGRVTVEGQPKGELSTIQLYLRNSGSMMGGSSAIAAADGSFTFKDVALDKYQLSVRFPGEEAFVKSVRVGPKEMPDNAVDLTQGTGAMDVVISLSPAKVEGAVTRDAPDGQGSVPASAVSVVLVPEGGVQDLWGGMKMGSTDAQGHFSIKSVKPGKYKAFAAEYIEMTQWADPDLAKALDSSGVSVEVAEKDDKQIQLKLITAEESSRVLEKLGL